MNIELLLKITLALIMISIGSSISFSEVKKVFKKPKKILWGLLGQMIFFPLIAFILATIANIPVEYKIGLVILAACPGGTLSNFISYIIKADTPLAVGLTSSNSIITLFTIPLYVNLAMLYFLKNSASIVLPLSTMILEIFTILIIPLGIGLLINALYKKILKYEKYLKIISSILLGAVFLVKFLNSTHDPAFFSNFSKLIIWAVLLNVSGVFLGWTIGLFNKFPRESKTTLGIEIGLQNTVLALLVTDVLLKTPAMGEPALVYAMFSFWVTLIISTIMNRNNKKIKIKNYFNSSKKP